MVIVKIPKRVKIEVAAVVIDTPTTITIIVTTKTTTTTTHRGTRLAATSHLLPLPGSSGPWSGRARSCPARPGAWLIEIGRGGGGGGGCGGGGGGSWCDAGGGGTDTKPVHARVCGPRTHVYRLSRA